MGASGDDPPEVASARTSRWHDYWTGSEMATDVTLGSKVEKHETYIVATIVVTNPRVGGDNGTGRHWSEVGGCVQIGGNSTKKEFYVI